MKKIFFSFLMIFIISFFIFDIKPEIPERMYEDTIDIKPAGASYISKAARLSALASKNDDIAAAEKKIYDGLVNIEEKIIIGEYHLQPDELKAVFEKISYTNAELFYVQTSYSYSHSEYVNYFYPKYKCGKDEASAQKKEFEAAVNKLAAAADNNWSPLETALYFHDYIASHYQYDINYNNYDAYNLLKTGKGVCQAYSLLYSHLLKMCGIPASFVKSDSMGHAWNAVMIDNKWYHVDITWDDPLNNGYGMANHDYFLLSDKELKKRDHDLWYCVEEDIICSDEYYDDFLWNGVSAPFAFSGGDWYFIGKADSNAYALKKTDFSSTSIACPLDFKWYVAGTDSYWRGFYSGLAAADGEIIFNTAKMVLSYNAEADTLNCLKLITAEADQIYGLLYDDGITFAIQQSPNDTSWILQKTTELAIGDSNADGRIDPKDVTYLRRFLAGNWNVFINFAASDLDNNSIIDDNDVLLLREYLAG